MTYRWSIVSWFIRTQKSPVFAIALLLIAVNSVQAEEVRFVARPSGPSLRVQAADKFITWMNENAPRWFHKNITYKGLPSWGKSETVQVYFDESLEERTAQIATRDKDGCWLVEERSIFGRLYEVRYGTMRWKLSTNRGTRIRMVELYQSAQELSGKTTMREVVDANDKPIMQFLAEQVPIIGEVVDQGTTILGLGDTVEKLVEVKAALRRFEREYNEINRHLGKNVVTIEGGYDAGEARGLRDRRFGGTERREKADCDTEPWNTMKPGERQVPFTAAKELTPGARAVLLEELEKPEKQRDFGRVITAMAQTPLSDCVTSASASDRLPGDVWLGKWSGKSIYMYKRKELVWKWWFAVSRSCGKYQIQTHTSGPEKVKIQKITATELWFLFYDELGTRIEISLRDSGTYSGTVTQPHNESFSHGRVEGRKTDGSR